MRKFRAIVALFMVIWIQITPWPLGLRSAHAFIPLPALLPLAPEAVGAAISASLVVGAVVYTQSQNGPDSFLVDAISGNIDRSVYIAKNFATSAGNQMMGFAHHLMLDFEKCSDWVGSHVADFPLFKSALDAATRSLDTPYIGNTYYNPLSGGNVTLTSIGAVNSAPNEGYASYYGTPTQYMAALGRVQTGFGWSNGSTVCWGVTAMPDNPSLPGYHFMSYTWAYFTSTATTEPITPPPSGGVDIPKFKEAYAHSPATQAEIDKMIFGNPAAVIPSSIPHLIPWQISAAHALASAKAAQAVATTAATVAAADPTNTALQVAAAQAQAVADQSAITAEATQAQSELEQAKEAEKIDEPDIPYNPNALDAPYTLPEVDFGQRLRDFVTAAKGTSIFSLPNSVFGNIPGAGNSQMTINGGQIFGTHIFDFADLSSMWLVLRGIVLTGFSFIAVRVVTLKK